MTREEQDKAYRAACELLHRLKVGSPKYKLATTLVECLQPPPMMEIILEKLPGETVTAKAAALGISRPHYYSIKSGQTRISPSLAYKLAALTGVPESSIRVA